MAIHPPVVEHKFCYNCGESVEVSPSFKPKDCICANCFIASLKPAKKVEDLVLDKKSKLLGGG